LGDLKENVFVFSLFFSCLFYFFPFLVRNSSEKFFNDVRFKGVQGV